MTWEAPLDGTSTEVFARAVQRPERGGLARALSVGTLLLFVAWVLAAGAFIVAVARARRRRALARQARRRAIDDRAPLRHDPRMSKTRTVHACVECGTGHPKWSGQCTGCGAWNTLVEELTAPPPGAVTTTPIAELELLHDIDALLAQPHPTGIGELDRVLGGGLVPGSVTLLGGEPGIGKSTLLLQLAAWWPGTALYVSAEESPQQVRLRAERLGAVRPELWLTADTSLAAVVDAIERTGPTLVVVDSIQTIADHAAHGVGRFGHAGSRVRPTARRRGEAARCRRGPRRPRHQGRLAGRTARCSSTSSTRCCRSRATATTRCACCGPSSTASAAPTSSGCSR